MLQQLVSEKHGPENAAMWIVANQPKPAAHGPQLDTTPAVAQDYIDDGSTPGSSPGSPAAQLPGGEEARPGDAGTLAPAPALN
jgi:hypothetical protein